MWRWFASNRNLHTYNLGQVVGWEVFKFQVLGAHRFRYWLDHAQPEETRLGVHYR